MSETARVVAWDQDQVSRSNRIQHLFFAHGKTALLEDSRGISVLLIAKDGQSGSKGDRLDGQVHPVNGLVREKPIMHARAAQYQPLTQGMNMRNKVKQVRRHVIRRVQPELGFPLPSNCFC